MKNKTLIFALIFICAAAGADRAHAVGLGGYFSYQKVFAKTSYFDKGDLNSEYDWIGGGLLLDTTIAADRLFNYRLNVGFHKVTFTLNGISTGLNGTGCLIDNTFGFGLYRSKKIRFWLGPQIGIGAVWAENNAKTIDQLDFTCSIGAAAGLNFHIGDRFTISGTVAYRGVLAIGGEDNEITGDDAYILTGNGVNFTLSAIVRFGDTYTSQAAAKNTSTEDMKE